MNETKKNRGEAGLNMRDNADPTSGLATSIRLRRRALRLTQENLSDISGISLRLIHELEHGKESVRLENLIKILASMGLHLELKLGASEHITIDPALIQVKR